MALREIIDEGLVPVSTSDSPAESQRIALYDEIEERFQSYDELLMTTAEKICRQSERVMADETTGRVDRLASQTACGLATLKHLTQDEERLGWWSDFFEEQFRTDWMFTNLGKFFLNGLFFNIGLQGEINALLLQDELRNVKNLAKLGPDLRMPHWLSENLDHSLAEEDKRELGLLRQVEAGIVPFSSREGDCLVICDLLEMEEVFRHHRVTRESLDPTGGGPYAYVIKERDLPEDDQARNDLFLDWLQQEIKTAVVYFEKGQREFGGFIDELGLFLTDKAKASWEQLWRLPKILTISNWELSQERFWSKRGFDPVAAMSGLREGGTRVGCHPPSLFRFMIESQQRFPHFADIPAKTLFYLLLLFGGNYYDWDRGKIHSGPLKGFLYATSFCWEPTEDEAQMAGLKVESLQGKYPNRDSLPEVVIKPPIIFFTPQLTNLHERDREDWGRRILEQIGWQFLVDREGKPYDYASQLGLEANMVRRDPETNQVVFTPAEGQYGFAFLHLARRLGTLHFWAAHWNSFYLYKNSLYPFSPEIPCLVSWDILKEIFRISVKYPQDLLKAIYPEAAIYKVVGDMQKDDLEDRDLLK